MKIKTTPLLIAAMLTSAILYQAGVSEEVWIWTLVAGFILEIVEL